MTLKKITSNHEKLIIGINYKTIIDEFKNLRYIAKIGNSTVSLFFLEELQEFVLKYRFETEKDRLLKQQAIKEFGTNV